MRERTRKLLAICLSASCIFSGTAHAGEIAAHEEPKAEVIAEADERNGEIRENPGEIEGTGAEAGETRETAVEIKNGETYGDALTRDGHEEQWFKFTTPSYDGYLTLGFRHQAAAESGWDCSVYDTEHDDPIYYYNFKGGTTDDTSTPLGLAGGKEVYIRLWMPDLAAGPSNVNYNLTVNFTEDHFREKEYNNDRFAPTSISVNTDYSGMIGRTVSSPFVRDIDFYQVNLDRRSRTVLNLVRPEGAPVLDVVVYRLRGFALVSEFSCLFEGTKKQSDRYYLDGGVHYISVSQPDAADGDVPYEFSIDVVPSTVEMDQKELEIPVNRTGTLSASVLPETARDRSLKWEIEDQSIATVDQDGRVTALKEGETKVRAFAVAADDVDAFCNVKVTKAPDPEYSITVSPNFTVTEGASLESLENEVRGKVQIYDGGTEIDMPSGSKLILEKAAGGALTGADLAAGGTTLQFVVWLDDGNGNRKKSNESTLTILSGEPQYTLSVSPNFTVTEGILMTEFEALVRQGLTLYNRGKETAIPAGSTITIAKGGDYIKDGDLAVGGVSMNIVVWFDDGNGRRVRSLNESIVTILEDITKKPAYSLTVSQAFTVTEGISLNGFEQEVFKTVRVYDRNGNELNGLPTGTGLRIRPVSGDSLKDEDFAESGKNIDFVVQIYGDAGVINESKTASVTVKASEAKALYRVTVKDVNVKVGVSKEEFERAVVDQTSVYYNNEALPISDTAYFKIEASDKSEISANLAHSGIFEIKVTYTPVGVSAVGNVIVSDSGSGGEDPVTPTPAANPSQDSAPSQNAAPSENKVVVVPPNSIGKIISQNVAGFNMFFPESVPYLGQDWKKLLKNSTEIIYAMVDGQKVGVKKITLKRGLKPGNAVVTALTLQNGKKLKKKDISGAITFNINPYKITAENARVITGNGKVKKSQVKGLKCTFENNAGVSGVKVKKISPKMASYDSSSNKVTFSGFFDGTISANLIGVS